MMPRSVATRSGSVSIVVRGRPANGVGAQWPMRMRSGIASIRSIVIAGMVASSRCSPADASTPYPPDAPWVFT
jgi:hypothetical protein